LSAQLVEELPEPDWSPVIEAAARAERVRVARWRVAAL
jgi:hypothetical protein